MAEELVLTEGSREDKYKSLLPQIKALIEGETDLIANMANVTAALQSTFHFLWIGFYRVDDTELVLGPFQGPIACTRIKKGRGVCGVAWQSQATQLVPNVDEFPGHIACSSLSKSEIVVPVFKQGQLIAVLDIDSECLNDFTEIDRIYLEQLCTYL